MCCTIYLKQKQNWKGECTRTLHVQMCYFFFLCGDYFSPMSCCARTDKSNWWALEKTCCHGVLGPLGVHIHNKTCNMFVDKLRLIKKARGISSFLGTVFRLPFFFYWRTLSQYLYPRVWFLSLGEMYFWHVPWHIITTLLLHQHFTCHWNAFQYLYFQIYLWLLRSTPEGNQSWAYTGSELTSCDPFFGDTLTKPCDSFATCVIHVRFEGGTQHNGSCTWLQNWDEK